MKEIQQVVDQTTELLKKHTQVRHDIAAHFTSVKQKNDSYIAGLLVTVDGNDKIIRDYVTHLGTLKKNQDSESLPNSNNLNPQTHPHGHATVEKNDGDINKLEKDIETCDEKILKTNQELKKITESKKKIESENGVLVDKLEKLRNETTKNNNGLAEDTRNKVDGIKKIGIVLNDISTDFDQEGREVAKIEELLTHHITKENMPQIVPEYHPVKPFNEKPWDVKATAFMVADRDSSNGFHELSARIANLARQINRVAAV